MTVRGRSTAEIDGRRVVRIVYDGGGVKRTETSHLYDNYASPRTLLSASGVVQHDTCSFGTGYHTRGNPYRIGRSSAKTSAAKTRIIIERPSAA